ncbi:hypothetical protein HDU76_005671 [Blyttiomyces sp. JEL0837]|nr:hypothetical protein HDU76_005671 [Blyttiomyces sp. JEL0837]
MVTWAIANLSLVVLCVPKLMEAWEESHHQETKAKIMVSVPNASIFGENTSTSVGSQGTKRSLVSVKPLNSSVNDLSGPQGADVYDHINMLAVNEINNSSDILPDTHINLVRYNSWDPEAVDDWWTTDSGGYSAVTAMKMVEDGVHLVFGEAFSKTTRFSAQVLSHYQVPLCGALQGSLELSNKNLYKYFYRMHFGSGYGKYVVRLLKHWNVRRVAIVAGFDSLSLAQVADVESNLSKQGIKLITKVSLTPSMVLTSDYSLSYNILKAADARYILIMADADSISDYYYNSAAYDLINPKILWFGLSGPVPNSADVIGPYGEIAISEFQGFVVSSSDVMDEGGPLLQKFNQSWMEQTAVNSSWNPPLDVQDPGSKSFVYNRNAS